MEGWSRKAYRKKTKADCRKTSIWDSRLWVILLAAVVRMGFYGFSYFPQLDDYIQYGSYPLVQHPWAACYVKLGMYATRPLAGLADLYVWGRLWHHMWLPFFIITILHGLSAYFLIRAAEGLGLKLGMLFAVVFVLCPLNFEAAYWFSAASRLVVGTFFASLALLLQVRGKKAFSWLVQLISLLFYEQVAVLSLLISCLAAWKQRDKTAFATTVVNGCLLALYYITFAAAGPFGSRAAVTGLNMDALRSILASWNVGWYWQGVCHGLHVASPWYGLGALIFALCFAEGAHPCQLRLFVVGGLVFVASYLPLLFLQLNGVALRSAFVPLIGMAMMLDAAMGWMPWKNMITVLLAALFLCVAPGELADYRANYVADQRMLTYVLQNTRRDADNLITGAKARNVPTQFPFREHIMGITAFDWALTGAARAATHNPTLPYYHFQENGCKGEIQRISLEDFPF